MEQSHITIERKRGKRPDADRMYTQITDSKSRFKKISTYLDEEIFSEKNIRALLFTS